MAYLGLTPSERSTGESVKRGGITKAGNTRARRLLIEAAWSYRFPPRVSKDMQTRIGAAPRTAREIAWKAQMRPRAKGVKMGKRATLCHFCATPPVSERPHSSARAGVHKGARARNSRQNAVTVPVTPPCPNYFRCLLKAYILYLGV